MARSNSPRTSKRGLYADMCLDHSYPFLGVYVIVAPCSRLNADCVNALNVRRRGFARPTPIGNDTPFRVSFSLWGPRHPVKPVLVFVLQNCWMGRLLTQTLDRCIAPWTLARANR